MIFFNQPAIFLYSNSLKNLNIDLQFKYNMYEYNTQKKNYCIFFLNPNSSGGCDGGKLFINF